MRKFWRIIIESCVTNAEFPFNGGNAQHTHLSQHRVVISKNSKLTKWPKPTQVSGSVLKKEPTAVLYRKDFASCKLLLYFC